MKHNQQYNNTIINPRIYPGEHRTPYTNRALAHNKNKTLQT
ncbi:hypothetical protein [Sunxiuqinia elliptica]|nr:hypothetical protein [Sunxiuqinia elliptica]